jgi:hypothetical protein
MVKGVKGWLLEAGGVAADLAFAEPGVVHFANKDAFGAGELVTGAVGFVGGKQKLADDFFFHIVSKERGDGLLLPG